MVELFIRLGFSLAVVIGLLMAAAKVASTKLKTNNAQLGTVIARVPLARTASLTIVEVPGQTLVLGVTESGVTLITDLDPFEVAQAQEAAKSPTAPTAVAPEAGAGSPLAGSVLSPSTWTNAASAVRRLIAARSTTTRGRS